jgi:hypothetical protein
MMIVETASGQTHLIEISSVSQSELKLLKKAKYSFNWRETAKTYPLVKLTIAGQDEILGVMALADHPGDSRMEIKLLACSIENVGASKRFDGIVACFFAYACGESLKNYGELACVSLLPKTALKEHYIEKYRMLDGGRQVFLEGRPLFDLAKKNL